MSATPPPSPERWLQGAADPGRQALRQALDEGNREPETDLSRQRVWSRIQTPWTFRSDRRAWLLPYLLGAGSATLVAAMAALFTPDPGRLPADAPAPQARLAEPAEAPVPPDPTPERVAAAPGAGATAAPGSSAPVRPSGAPPIANGPVSRGKVALMTGPRRRAHHRLSRGVEAELAPRTTLVPGDESTPAEVRAGLVRFTVPRQPPGRRYLVRVRGYQVAVLGTNFAVGVDRRAVSVSVQSGVVEVEDAATGRRLERLEPGELWSSSSLGRLPRTNASASPAAARRAEAAAEPASPADAAAQALNEARAARRRGDAQGALAIYRRLAAAQGPSAESALYESGAIEDEDLSEPRRAQATWERYRTRYPQGALRAEADLSIIEVLARLGEGGRAFEEAMAFLRRHPDSERRGEVARVAGDLARTRADCGAAVSLYETAARSRLAPADADDAAFYRAACLGKLGDQRTTGALREYQSRFPAGRHAAEARVLLGAPGTAPGTP